MEMNGGATNPTDVSIITTYRCQMRCKMCDIWENPTDKRREITAKDLEILPSFKFVNVTGGEPFVRRDLEDIVEVMMQKSPRLVISTSGWHTERIFRLAEKYPNIGIRVSIEGLSQKNDELRGSVVVKSFWPPRYGHSSTVVQLRSVPTHRCEYAA